MCNRYSLIAAAPALAARFGIDESIFRLLGRGAKYNVAPTEESIVVVQDGEARLPKKMTFGLVPRWAKDPKIATQLLNARGETAAEKPAFRDSLRSRRCLVLTDGFYEWKTVGKKKIPQRIVMKDRSPFAFAGLWDAWTGPEGRTLESFTILTTEANKTLSSIHDRMPVILSKENEPLWTAPYVTEMKTIQPLLKPAPDDWLEIYEVDPYVNKAGNEGPRCVEPVAPLPELF